MFFIITLFPNIQDKGKWGAGLSPKRLCFGSGVDGRWSLQKTFHYGLREQILLLFGGEPKKAKNSC